MKVKVLAALSCLTLRDPMDCSPPGSSAHGILRARIVVWVEISFSRGSSTPRDQTWVSCIAGRFLTISASRKPICVYIYMMAYRCIYMYKMISLHIHLPFCVAQAGSEPPTHSKAQLLNNRGPNPSLTSCQWHLPPPPALAYELLRK